MLTCVGIERSGTEGKGELACCRLWSTSVLLDVIDDLPDASYLLGSYVLTAVTTQ